MNRRYTIRGLFVLCLCFVSVTVYCQDNNLSGIWQRYVKKDVSEKAQPLLFFKILGDDGSFCNMQLLPSGDAIKTHEGTYEQTSDGIYIENIDKTIIPNSPQKTSLKYRVDGNSLYLEYDTENKAILEIWKRVIVPNKE
ncbi:MAG: DUF4488 domain-containing protein [Prevotella sp.]|jgi:hypothetical protein|nr:DUF4488 domain-containing protein [Prevotella sp.]